MDYELWREDLFGHINVDDAYGVELFEETDSLSKELSLDYIDRALQDPEIHSLYTKQSIGIGLNIIYSNGLSDMPFCYTDIPDMQRRIRGIHNLSFLYTNFFDRYCAGPVESIGNDMHDGEIGSLCYMFWDIFVLWGAKEPPKINAAALRVMDQALRIPNDNCTASAIHGLGHWVLDCPEASDLLKQWLKEKKTQSRNPALIEYAQRATTGMIL